MLSKFYLQMAEVTGIFTNDGKIYEMKQISMNEC